MFVLYDGAYYYRVSTLKTSYAMTERVERLEDV